jgi:endonuclease/exonuclease/phosphatase family metal-dependent hydrolase
MGAGLLGGPPASAAEKGPTITVATYNICKQACGTGKFNWAKRRQPVVRNIVAAKADVVLVQEAASGWVYYLETTLGRHGYRLANAEKSNCGSSRQQCTLDSFVFYKTATIEPAPLRVANPPVPDSCQPFVGNDDPEPPFSEPGDFTLEKPERPWDNWDPDYEQRLARYRQELQMWEAARARYQDQWDAYEAAVDSWWREYQACQRYVGWTPFADDFEGMKSLAQVAKGQWPSNIYDRGWSWAYLRHKRTQAGFLAVSLHLPNEKTAAGERVRQTGTRGVITALNRDKAERGLRAIPTVVAGDLNSYQRRQPRGAQLLFKRAGYRDAYTAPRRTNGDAATVNVTTIYRDPFPAKPFRADDPARIDYVLAKRAKLLHYEVFLKLKGGRFDNRYRGSDHNLVLATMRLPRFRYR